MGKLRATDRAVGGVARIGVSLCAMDRLGACAEAEAVRKVLHRGLQPETARMGGGGERHNGGLLRDL